MSVHTNACSVMSLYAICYWSTQWLSSVWSSFLSKDEIRVHLRSNNYSTRNYTITGVCRWERLGATCAHVFIAWSDNTWCKGLTSLQLESQIYGLSYSDIQQLLCRKGREKKTYTNQGQSSRKVYLCKVDLFSIFWHVHFVHCVFTRW